MLPHTPQSPLPHEPGPKLCEPPKDASPPGRPRWGEGAGAGLARSASWGGRGPAGTHGRPATLASRTHLHSRSTMRRARNSDPCGIGPASAACARCEGRGVHGGELGCRGAVPVLVQLSVGAREARARPLLQPRQQNYAGLGCRQPRGSRDGEDWAWAQGLSRLSARSVALAHARRRSSSRSTRGSARSASGWDHLG